jgi:DNA end-binding protein Ku
MLIVLRHADEVILAEDVPAPGGRPLAKKEVEMAAQLVDALSGEFDPSEFADQYRARVLELVEAKARGKKVKVAKFRPRKQADDDSLDDVLAASLKSLGRKKASHG